METNNKITEILKNSKTSIIHNDMAVGILNKFKENVFATEFVDDDTATILLETILFWKKKADMYDDLCD